MLGWYKKVLLKHNMIIVPQPSWEGITFHNNMGEDKCIWFLAKRGITLDEADDCHDFTYTWIQENNTPDEKDMQLHILLSQTRADSHPTLEPWHKPVLHRFNETHTRWVPIILPPL